MDFPLDRYCRYDELTAFLTELAAAYPELVEVESIGRSHEGRDIWLATVTDRATGAHGDKPAMWVDGNIHATELTASAAAIGLLRRLVTGYGSDARVTEALRTRTFYVVPRVNPDGAELALADTPRWLRSSVRAWPWLDRWEAPGLHRIDIDGDGRVLTMRVEDPTGGWTTHVDDARLMVPVPADGIVDRPRYRMLAEGRIVDHDGYTVPRPHNPEGLDLNRNFPAGWGTSVTGSGDHPGSEPEVLALVRAMTARPNICGSNAYHTFGGVLLRPSSTKSDGDLPPADVWMWKQLGAKCTELSTYPVHSVYEDFTWDKHDTMSGAGDDWAYEHLGVFSWTTEFWDAVHAATGERAPTSVWYVTLEPEVELKVLRWFDEHHPEAYVDWYEFDHPELGRVELGGWDWLRSWSNPPPARLEAEVAPHAEFAVFQALCSPRLQIEQVTAAPLGEDVWQLTVGIANVGYLPTTVTEWGAKHSLTLPVSADLVLPDAATLAPGTTNRKLLGQLAGYSDVRFSDFNDGTPNRAVATWIVRAPSGVTIDIVARHQRAGTVWESITLGSIATEDH
ncbi:MAG: M14 family metallopeptidase [Ilumatobacteraceae bacterium]